jgi:hypothetical protein
MTKRPWPTFFRLLALGAAISLFSHASARAQTMEIGVAAAVNPNATGTPPSRETRVLNVGVNVFGNEVIRTSDKGQTQMLFADESALTIGPNSEVTLDEFVYDPNQKTGKIALSATKGLFRLVGGRISKTTPVTLKTPTATIGIRGGIALVNVAPSGATSATFLFGDQMSVTNGSGSKSVNRPGYAVTTESAEQEPSDPEPAPPQALDAAFGGMEGSAEQTPDSAPNAPTAERVEAAGVSGGSEQAPQAVAPQRQGPPPPPAGNIQQASETSDETTDTATQANEITSGGTQDLTGATSTSGFSVAGSFPGRYKTNPGTGTLTGTGDSSSSFNIGFTNGAISNGFFTATTGSSTWKAPIQSGTFSFGSSGTSSAFGPVQGTGFLSTNSDFLFYEVTEDNHPGDRALLWAGKAFSGTLPTGATFHALQNDFALNSNIPFMRNASGVSLTLGTAESKADTAIYWNASGSTTAQRPWAHLSLLINGTGSSQKSVFVVAGGEVLLDSSSRPFIKGGVGGSSRLTATASPIRIDGELSSADDGNGADFFGTSTPDYFVLESGNVNTGDVLQSRDLKEVNGATSTTYFPNAVAVPATETIGTRTSKNMHGYAGGAMQTLSSSGTLTQTELFRNKTSDPNDIHVQTSATANKVSAAIDVADAFSDGVSIANLSTEFGDRDVGAFSNSVSTTGDSAFIDNNIFGASDSLKDSSGNSIKGAEFASGSSVTVANLHMFTSDDDQLNGTSFIPSGVTLCTCNFMAWGFWGGDITRADGTHEIIHLANWVAGEVSSFYEISALTGTATYGGHAIGTVLNGTSVYQAVGAWSYTVNFGSPSTSSGTLNSFDSHNYTLGGSTFSSGTDSRNTFSGSIAGVTDTGKTGSFKGSFMKNGTDVAGGMGGHFQIDGGSYKASGVFAGQK